MNRKAKEWWIMSLKTIVEHLVLWRNYLGYWKHPEIIASWIFNFSFFFLRMRHQSLLILLTWWICLTITWNLSFIFNFFSFLNCCSFSLLLFVILHSWILARLFSLIFPDNVLGSRVIDFQYLRSCVGRNFLIKNHLN